MKAYTLEYIAYVQKYPYTVTEDFKNGIKKDSKLKRKSKLLK